MIKSFFKMGVIVGGLTLPAVAADTENAAGVPSLRSRCLERLRAEYEAGATDITFKDLSLLLKAQLACSIRSKRPIREWDDHENVKNELASRLLSPVDSRAQFEAVLEGDALKDPRLEHRAIIDSLGGFLADHPQRNPDVSWRMTSERWVQIPRRFMPLPDRAQVLEFRKNCFVGDIVLAPQLWNRSPLVEALCFDCGFFVQENPAYIYTPDQMFAFYSGLVQNLPELKKVELKDFGRIVDEQTLLHAIAIGGGKLQELTLNYNSYVDDINIPMAQMVSLADEQNFRFNMLPNLKVLKLRLHQDSREEYGWSNWIDQLDEPAALSLDNLREFMLLFPSVEKVYIDAPYPEGAIDGVEIISGEVDNDPFNPFV